MKNQLNSLKERIFKIIEKRPVISFLIALAVFISLIVVGNVLRKPAEQTHKEILTKKVNIYTIGSVPKISFQAKVEKSGVVQIVSSAAGVVNRINVKEGTKVNLGTTLLTLSTNYAGANAATVSRQLAEKQNQLVQSTYETQKEIISKQRNLAKEGFNNFKEMQEVNKKSTEDTDKIVKLNDQIIDSLNTNIENLSSDPTGNASLILSSKQLLSQFLSANSQLRSAIRNLKLQTDNDKPQRELAEEQKSVTLKQLDVQEASLDLSREISELQLKLARISESLMYPTSPFTGVVEQLLVKQEQFVNPGTPLMIISSDTAETLKATVYVTKEIAEEVSRVEKTTLLMGSTSVELLPAHISREATNGSLYSITFYIPQEFSADVADNGFITAKVPVGYADTSAVVPYIPLDSVYQTQENAYTFVVEDGKAVSKKIELGDVFGSFVRVNSGLSGNTQIITDRNVVDGDLIQTN
jgi:multidrug efflux pump subunit AcrA (membrane-fusion protein)